MEHGDMWREMRKRLSDMAETVDEAVRKVPPFSSFARPGYPPVNVYEAEEELIVRAEVPGVPKESLNVNLKGGALVIEGKEDRSEYEGYECVCKERGAGEFSREISLPETVDAEAEPAASVENGVLTIRLKLKPREEGTTVRVEVS